MHNPSIPGENRQGLDRHPEFGLPARLLIDGELHIYDRYLDAWVDTLGKRELTGWTILQGMSLNLRVEVAS
jgi:hypothetical protein